MILTCNVFGHVDHFHWIHENPNGEVTNLTLINKTVNGNSTSYIYYVDAVGLADEGIYRCEAENDAGVSYGNGDIYVSVKKRETTPVGEYSSAYRKSTMYTNREILSNEPLSVMVEISMYPQSLLQPFGRTGKVGTCNNNTRASTKRN